MTQKVHLNLCASGEEKEEMLQRCDGVVGEEETVRLLRAHIADILGAIRKELEERNLLQAFEELLKQLDDAISYLESEDIRAIVNHELSNIEIVLLITVRSGLRIEMNVEKITRNGERP